MINSVDSEYLCRAQAAVYVAGARQQWERHPAALAALLQLRNLSHLNKWLEDEMDLPQDRTTALEYINGLDDVRLLARVLH